MEDFQKRVIEEEKELREKIENLTDFRMTETWEGLANEDQRLLNLQLHAMIEYRSILLKRIQRFH